MDKIGPIPSQDFDGTPGSRRAPGFSLIELLAVLAAISLLAVLVLPALQSISTGSNLVRGGQMIGDQILLARQLAVANNCDVQVIFFKLSNGATQNWRGVQIWMLKQTNNGPVSSPASKLAILPDGIIITSTAWPSGSPSPLLTASGTTGTTTLPVFGSVPYAGFRFRANGSTETTINSANNFLTLQNANITATPPPNYYMLQVNPVTGKVAVFRP